MQELLYNICTGKGHLISKANCQAVNSSKKRMNEFVFTSMRRVFVCFLEEISENASHTTGGVSLLQDIFWAFLTLLDLASC